MKILVNVARKVFSEDWQECEAVKFVEQPDGSFDVRFTRDLARSRELEADLAKSEAEIRKALS